MDDAILYYTAIVTALFIGLTLVILLLVDVRAQAEERKELHRLLLMALFRMSKDQIKTLEEQTRHVDAVGITLLRALRQGDGSAALLAELRREMEQPPQKLSEGESPLTELPPGGTDKPPSKE